MALAIGHEIVRVCRSQLVHWAFKSYPNILFLVPVPVLKLAQYCCDRAAVFEIARAKSTSRDANDRRVRCVSESSLPIV